MGRQILGAIVTAAETVESGEAPEGKNADKATNPIEAAIGGGGGMTIRMLLHSQAIWKKMPKLQLLLF
ncbi:hypothetical protein [Borreliella valaisiana]|uniref:hypothetical protein n=1 Tax=Borreliella valaisiana TaxID=62088 RepID=UPI001AEDFA3F|nr:hypothetical protein [Borreliella valaisiana]